MATATAVLATGTGTALNPGISAVGSIPANAFPAHNLNVTVELQLNSVWTDVTRYCYVRSGISISGMGRADWTSQIQAASMTLTLNNRDGRFSPKYAGGAYWPYITRNVQVRVSVNAQSATGVAYNGYRFWGEISEWPIRWDPSESDITAEVTAAGIWRRISQMQTTLGSAYTRYTSLTLTGTSAPRSYWPMEDGSGSTQLVPYDSVAGTGNATFTVLGTNVPSLAACTDFKGSDAIVTLNGAMITCTVPAGGTATNNVTRMCVSVPAAGDSAAGGGNWNLLEIDSAGTVAKLEVYLMGAGTLQMQGRNSGGTVVFTGTTTNVVKGSPVLLSCELTPSGGNVAWAMRIITQGAGSITESVTGTLTTASVGAISAVKVSRANVLNDTAVGQLSVTYGAVPSMVSAAAALGGYAGEKAMDRFTRICGEMGIPAETTGTASATAAMGPQLDDHLAGVLQTIEDTDCGLLFESRGQFGLGYRGNASMANQASAATLSYTAAVLDTSLAPVYDDSLTRNNITVTNSATGYTQQAILSAGALSVLNPPSGVGNGYAFSRTVSVASDSQVAGIATFLLNQGTVDEIRFPVVTLKMIRRSNAALFSAVPGLRIGDYFQITNPPSFLTSTTIKQLMWGYTETLNAKEWTFSFNTVPETCWETGFSPGTTQTAQIPGGSASVSTAPGTGLGPVISNGSITPAMLNEGITIHTLGGNASTISSGAPATPNTGDMWIDSDTGLISEWDGATWQPVKFDGSATIQAATITAAQIVAHTITATQIQAASISAAELAAGIVVAGIVDATTVQALQFIATGSSGELMVYDGTPGSTTLAASVSGRAATDAYSNAFAKGVHVHKGGLILDNQASAPSAVTGATQLYSSIAGRLRYLASTGENTILERGTINVGTFTVGNTVTAGTISGPLSYIGTAASNQSSTFEIEISGAFHTATSGVLHRPIFALFVDGTQLGNEVQIGGAATILNSWFAYTIRFRLSVLSSGAPGTACLVIEGGIAVEGAAIGSISNSFLSLGATTSSSSFDTTANHTLQAYAWWDVTNSGQEFDTFVTRTTNYS